MTQIKSFMGATRRPGELGVHSLDAFNLVVPDMKQAQAFYTSFGLDLQARGNRLDVHTMGHRHRWGTITEGASKQLSHVSFGVFEEDFAAFKERMQKLAWSNSVRPRDLNRTACGFEIRTGFCWNFGWRRSLRQTRNRPLRCRPLPRVPGDPAAAIMCRVSSLGGWPTF
jgi:hypothetical protein